MPHNRCGLTVPLDQGGVGPLVTDAKPRRPELPAFTEWQARRAHIAARRCPVLEHGARAQLPRDRADPDVHGTCATSLWHLRNGPAVKCPSAVDRGFSA